MFINVDNLPKDIRWMCGSDFQLIINAARYCSENNKPYIYIGKEFRDYCLNNNLCLALSTMNQKFSWYTRCMIAEKLDCKKFRLNEKIFIH